MVQLQDVRTAGFVPVLTGGDALRAMAALSVFAYHAAFRAGLNEPPGQHGLVGQVLLNLDLGLYVFFVLSGYLICRPWLADGVRGASRDWKSYCRRRILRIVPPLWVLGGLIFVVHSAASWVGWTEISTASGVEVAAVLFFVVPQVGRGFTAMMGHAWTLSLELSFYLALPVLAFALSPLIRIHHSLRRRATTIFVVIVVVSLASMAARALAPETVAWRRNLVTLGFAFSPGVFLALIEVSVSERSRLRFARISRWPFAMGAFAFAALRAGSLGDRHDFFPWVSWVAAALAAAAAGCFLGFVWASQWAHPSTKAPTNNRLRVGFDILGRWSYSFYILHQAVVLFLADALGFSNGWTLFLAVLILGVPLTTGLAGLGYRLVERPAVTQSVKLNDSRPSAEQPQLGSGGRCRTQGHRP